MRTIRYGKYERAAMFILLLLVIAQITFQNWSMNKANEKLLAMSIKWELDTLNTQDDASDVLEEKSSRPSAPVKKELRIFPFDPNLLPGDSLKLIGLPGYVVRNWIKYRDKGGKFRKKEDVKKIFGLSDLHYSQLSPYLFVKLETGNEKQEEIQTTYPNRDTTKILAVTPVLVPLELDINLASLEEWQELKGIGPVLSERIHKYRRSLGGFYKIDQLSEVYGIADETFEAIKSQLVLNEVKLEKININTVTFKELLKHPYVDINFCKRVMRYRDQHEKIENIEEMSSIYLLDQVLLEKLKPYLDFSAIVPAG